MTKPNTITVQHEDGSTDVKVVEWIGNYLAIHRDIADRTKWAITHAPSGSMFFTWPLDSKADAVKIARKLIRDLRGIIRLTSKQPLKVTAQKRCEALHAARAAYLFYVGQPRQLLREGKGV